MPGSGLKCLWPYLCGWVYGGGVFVAVGGWVDEVGMCLDVCVGLCQWVCVCVCLVVFLCIHDCVCDIVSMYISLWYYWV